MFKFSPISLSLSLSLSLTHTHTQMRHQQVDITCTLVLSRSPSPSFSTLCQYDPLASDIILLFKTVFGESHNDPFLLISATEYTPQKKPKKTTNTTTTTKKHINKQISQHQMPLLSLVKLCASHSSNATITAPNVGKIIRFSCSPT